jgi:predicted phosphatase
MNQSQSKQTPTDSRGKALKCFPSVFELTTGALESGEILVAIANRYLYWFENGCR